MLPIGISWKHLNTTLQHWIRHDSSFAFWNGNRTKILHFQGCHIMNKNECLDVSVLQTLGMTLLAIFQLYRVCFLNCCSLCHLCFMFFSLSPTCQLSTLTLGSHHRESGRASLAKSANLQKPNSRAIVQCAVGQKKRQNVVPKNRAS